MSALFAMFIIQGCRKKADTSPEQPAGTGHAQSSVSDEDKTVSNQADHSQDAVDGSASPIDRTRRQRPVATREDGRTPRDDASRRIPSSGDSPRPRPIQIPDDEWTVYFDAARKKAVAEKKHLLLNFSGSDWCPLCIRLDREIFSTESFRAQAGRDFVMVTIDFPQDISGLTPEIQAQNIRLQKQFGINAYPTVILTDAEGRPYALTGYQAGGPEAYLEHLRELKDHGAKIQRLFFDAQKASDNLEKAKLLDQALGMLPEEFIFSAYADQVDQIIAFDPDNKATLKAKYDLQRRLTNAINSLVDEDYSAAVKTLDAIIAELNPQDLAAQEVYLAKAQAMHALNRPQDERQSLQEAFAAAPGSPSAEHIRQFLNQYFPTPPKLVMPAKVTTTMRTYQTYVPQRAFDGNLDGSYFWSAGEVRKGETFTIVLEKPGDFKTVEAYTGTAQLPNLRLYNGVLEVSTDGDTFSEAATFGADGVARASVSGKTIKAVRLRCTEDQPQWLVIREVVLK